MILKEFWTIFGVLFLSLCSIIGLPALVFISEIYKTLFVSKKHYKDFDNKLELKIENVQRRSCAFFCIRLIHPECDKKEAKEEKIAA